MRGQRGAGAVMGKGRNAEIAGRVSALILVFVVEIFSQTGQSETSSDYHSQRVQSYLNKKIIIFLISQAGSSLSLE